MNFAPLTPVQLIAQAGVTHSLETRNNPLQADRLDCEVRFSSLSDDGAIEGLAVRFDVVDTYRTTFDRRAFAWDGKSLPLLWSHRADEVVGSIPSSIIMFGCTLMTSLGPLSNHRLTSKNNAPVATIAA